MIVLCKETMQECFPGQDQHILDLYREPLTIAMLSFNINTTKRAAAFLAQVAHESGCLEYSEEIASGRAYEYRKDLGNLETEAIKIAHAAGTTTGRFYKGRGIIQITGFYNYRACGKALNLDLIHFPVLLIEPLNSCKAAGWFWDTHNCNNYADMDMFEAITRSINGGLNGYSDRKSHHRRIKAIFACK